MADVGNGPERPEVLPPSWAGQYTVNVLPGSVNVYQLNEQQLDSLASSRNSVSMNFFTLTAGALLSFLGVFLTLPLESTAYAVIIPMTVMLSILTVFFGILAVLDYFRARSEIARIKETAARSIQQRG